MTTITEHAAPGGPTPPARDRPADRPRRWWRRPWTFPLMFVALAFIGFSLPPYLTFDPANSRIPVPETVVPYFPLLVAHVTFGAVAMVTSTFQIWPAFRRRFRRAHRLMGRAYVFAGVLPAGLTAFVIGVVTPFGPTNMVSNVLMSSLWLVFTIVGFRMARQRRFADHRRWMIRSFALTFSIITNRVWGAVGFIVLTPRLDTTFKGSEVALQQATSAIAAWLGWTSTLLLAEWWLERDRRPRRAGNRRVVADRA